MLEVLALDHFVDAIPDSDIRMRLREVGPKNILEAERLAVKLEAYKVADKDRKKTVHACAEQSETSVSDLGKEIAKLQQEIRNLKGSNGAGPRMNYRRNFHGAPLPGRQQSNQPRRDLNGQQHATHQGNGAVSRLGGAARQNQQ